MYSGVNPIKLEKKLLCNKLDCLLTRKIFTRITNALVKSQKTFYFIGLRPVCFVVLFFPI